MPLGSEWEKVEENRAFSFHHSNSKVNVQHLPLKGLV